MLAAMTRRLAVSLKSAAVAPRRGARPSVRVPARPASLATRAGPAKSRPGGHTAPPRSASRPSADGSRGREPASTDRTVRDLVAAQARARAARSICPPGSDLQGSASSAAFLARRQELGDRRLDRQLGTATTGPWCVYILDVGAADIQRSLCDLPKARAPHDLLAGRRVLPGLAQGRRRASGSIAPATTAWSPRTRTTPTNRDLGRRRRRRPRRDLPRSTARSGSTTRIFRRIAIATMPEGPQSRSPSASRPTATRIAVGYGRARGQRPAVAAGGRRAQRPPT